MSEVKLKEGNKDLKNYDYIVAGARGDKIFTFNGKYKDKNILIHFAFFKDSYYNDSLPHVLIWIDESQIKNIKITDNEFKDLVMKVRKNFIEPIIKMSAIEPAYKTGTEEDIYVSHKLPENLSVEFTEITSNN